MTNFQFFMKVFLKKKRYKLKKMYFFNFKICRTFASSNKVIVNEDLKTDLKTD